MIGFFLFFFSLLSAETVSVIIPCYYKHADHLPTLLEHLCHQTKLPDEVVISLSEADKCDSMMLESLKNGHYPFKLKLLQTNQILRAGPNRNIACKQAKGDLLITQDADDIPHPQRVEILKFIFKHNPVDLVIHKWIPSDPGQMAQFYWGHYNASKIPVRKMKDANQLTTLSYITRGNIGIRKQVFEKIKWMDTGDIGEDAKFCIDACKKFTLCVIDANLLIYCQ